MPFDGVTYLRCEDCGAFVVEGEATAHELGCEGTMTKSRFVIMVQANRAPIVLGPMSEETRVECLRDLRRQYGPKCGLHELDISARSVTRVTATVR